MGIYSNVLRAFPLLCLAALPLFSCSSNKNSDPNVLRSYAQGDIVAPIRFTVDLEIKIVDREGRPVPGVRVYAKNPYFHQYVFTGQSGTAVLNGTFSTGQLTLLDFDGPGIRWTEELHQELPARTRSVTLKVLANGDGRVQFAGMSYYPL